MNDRWYYCIEHDEVEPEVGCPAKNRLGPYPTRSEAEDALGRVKARNARWKAEDERWDGEN